MVCRLNANNVKLFNKFKLKDLIIGSIDTAAISNLSYTNGRKLGLKRANKIINSASKLETHIKILMKIPRISKKCAVAILSNFTLKYILENWDTIKHTIKDIKIGLKKIGSSCILNIEKYLLIP